MKAICPKCKKEVMVNVDGTFRAHGYTQTHPYWCKQSWEKVEEVAANHMAPETRGKPKDGMRRNGVDPWKEELLEDITKGLITAFNKKDREYGHYQQNRGVNYFTFEVDGKLRTIQIKVIETK